MQFTQRSTSLLLILAGLLLAEPPPPKSKLDMTSLQVDFREGELDVVKNLLESFLKNQGSTATRDEKIFAFKYLGVIYAANANGKEKAESYFNQLLPLAPNIELADMYVSKNIQALFDDVKREYLHTQDYATNFDAFGNPKANAKTGVVVKTDKPKTESTSLQSGSGKSHTWMWWVGGITLAAAGTGAIILATESGSTPSGKAFTGGTGGR